MSDTEADAMQQDQDDVHTDRWPPQFSDDPQKAAIIEEINMSVALVEVSGDLFWSWLRSHGAPEETEALYDALLAAVERQIEHSRAIVDRVKGEQNGSQV